MKTLLANFLKKRPLSFRMNVVLLASGLAVGLTRYYLLPGHRGWSVFITCIVAGYFASVLVAVFAGALCAALIGLNFKSEFERVIIIAGMTLIVASVLLFLVIHSGGSFEDSD